MHDAFPARLFGSAAGGAHSAVYPPPPPPPPLLVGLRPPLSLDHLQLKVTIRTVRVRSRVYANGRASVRPSVCVSVPSFDLSRGVRRVCCRAPRGREISIVDSGGRCANSSIGAAAQGRSTALSSKCGQCHVDS